MKSKFPHGIWPSGDGKRVYVGLENDDHMIAIDTLANTVIASIPIGQAAQAVVYVPEAVQSGTGTHGPLGAGPRALRMHRQVSRPSFMTNPAGAQIVNAIGRFDKRSSVRTVRAYGIW